MDINMTIAENIRNAREEKNLTLNAAANITGVSRSMLVQIEKGVVNPTISVIWKIANGYKVSFTSLIENTNKEDTLITAVSPLIDNNGKYKNYPTFPFDEQKGFEMYRIVIEVGGYLDAQPHLTLSEEYVTVFSGTVEIMVSDKAYTLNMGDALRFKADQPHSYRNTSDIEASISMMIYYAK